MNKHHNSDLCEYFLYFQVSPEVVHLYRPDAIARFEITRTLPVIYLGTKCTPLAVTVVTTKDIATKTACTVEFNKSLTVNETQTFELRRRVSSRPQIAVYDIEFLVHTTKCHASWSDLAKRQQLISLFPKVKVSLNKLLSLFTF